MDIAFPGAADGTNHFSEIDELEKTQADREEDAHGEQAVDQDIAPENRVQEIDNCGHRLAPCDL